MKDMTLPPSNPLASRELCSVKDGITGILLSSGIPTAASRA
jgi:hypothetical protein